MADSFETVIGILFFVDLLFSIESLRQFDHQYWPMSGRQTLIKNTEVLTIYNKGCTVTYVDYNFRIKERLSFYIGMGIGFAAIDYEYPKWVSVDTYTQEYAFSRSAVLSPRVGVEFFKRLRLTIEYRLMRKDYSCFGINLGFSIGGR